MTSGTRAAGDNPPVRRPGRVVSTLAELVARLGGELVGDGTKRVSGVASLTSATADQLAYIADSRHRSAISTTHAGALVVGPGERDASDLPRIVVPNPQLYFVAVTRLLHPEVAPAPGIHPTAVVEDGATVAPTAVVGPHVSIGSGAVLGARSVVGAGCRIGAGTTLGEDCLLHANVVVYHDCHIGSRVVMHSGVVIGADGFGLVREGERWSKVPQIGRVLIGDDVEIGANTTIDRGALDDTVIEEGVKLDNQIQIGHNCRIGAHTAIAGCVGIAGSARIGRHCMIGGAAGIHGHLEICDGCTISAFTLITKSIRVPGTYTSATPFMEHREWARNTIRLRQLDKLAQRVRSLERSQVDTLHDEPEGDPL